MDYAQIGVFVLKLAAEELNRIQTSNWDVSQIFGGVMVFIGFAFFSAFQKLGPWLSLLLILAMIAIGFLSQCGA